MGTNMVYSEIQVMKLMSPVSLIRFPPKSKLFVLSSLSLEKADGTPSSWTLPS